MIDTCTVWCFVTIYRKRRFMFLKKATSLLGGGALLLGLTAGVAVNSLAAAPKDTMGIALTPYKGSGKKTYVDQTFYTYVGEGEKFDFLFAINGHNWRGPQGGDINVRVTDPAGKVVYDHSVPLESDSSDGENPRHNFGSTLSSDTPGVWMIEAWQTKQDDYEKYGLDFQILPGYRIGAKSASGDFIGGRTFTDTLNIRQRGSKPQASDLNLQVLNNQGFQYQVGIKDFFGWDSGFYVDNLGYVDANCNPTKRSSDPVPYPQALFHGLEKSYDHCDVYREPYRIFYDGKIDTSMPEQVEHWADGRTSNKWLNPKLELNGDGFARFDFNYDGVGKKTGEFEVVSNFSSIAKIDIDTDNDTKFDRTFEFPVKKGELTKVPFDGKTHTGADISDSKPMSAQITFDEIGSVYFLRTDAAYSNGGIMIKPVNKPGATDKYLNATVHWDDSKFAAEHPEVANSGYKVKSDPDGMPNGRYYHGWDWFDYTQTWGADNGAMDWINLTSDAKAELSMPAPLAVNLAPLTIKKTYDDATGKYLITLSNPSATSISGDITIEDVISLDDNEQPFNVSNPSKGTVESNKWHLNLGPNDSATVEAVLSADQKANHQHFVNKACITESNVCSSVDTFKMFDLNVAPNIKTVNKEIYAGESIDFIDQLVTSATDKEDGDVKKNVTVEDQGGFNSEVLGDYIISFKVADSNGATNTNTSRVTVKGKLSYDANGGEGNTPTGHDIYAKRDYEIANGSSLSRDGYVFLGWNTSPDGNGETYDVGSNRQFTTSTTLYAKWHKIPELEAGDKTIYVGDPLDPTSLVTKNVDGNGDPITDVKIVDDGGFTNEKIGTYTVTLQTTDKTGVSTTAKAKVTVKAKLTYNLNGGEGTTPADSDIIKDVANKVATDEGFSAPDAVFKGWNTAPDGSGQSVKPGSDQVFESNTTLYAQWHKLPTLIGSERTINVGDEINPMDLVTKAVDGEGNPLSNVKMVDNDNFSNKNIGRYTFTFTGTDASGHEVSDTGSITVVGSLAYDPNGASGQPPAPEKITPATPNKIADPGELAMDKAVFEGWTTSRDGDDVIAPGDEKTFDTNTTLYAKWHKLPSITTTDKTIGACDKIDLNTLVTESVDGYGKKISEIKISGGDFDTCKLGDNKITYEITDNKGFKSTSTATVHVQGKVTYDPNGGEGEVPATQLFNKNDPVIIGDGSTLRNGDKTFAGWSLDSKCEAGVMASGDKQFFESNVTLFACYEDVPTIPEASAPADKPAKAAPAKPGLPTTGAMGAGILGLIAVAGGGVAMVIRRKK